MSVVVCERSCKGDTKSGEAVGELSEMVSCTRGLTSSDWGVGWEWNECG